MLALSQRKLDSFARNQQVIANASSIDHPQLVLRALQALYAQGGMSTSVEDADLALSAAFRFVKQKDILIQMCFIVERIANYPDKEWNGFLDAVQLALANAFGPDMISDEAVRFFFVSGSFYVRF